MIAIISVTKLGDSIADKLSNILESKIYYKSKLKSFKLDDITKTCFEKFDSIIFISSTGIAVRAISKYLISKDVDPAVLVVDVCNNFTISLVSGHLGGANELTIKVSDILKNTPVITTATDNLKKVAPDILAKDNNLVIEDLKKAKHIASRLVNDEEVYFLDDFKSIRCPRGYKDSDTLLENSVWITDKIYFDDDKDKNYQNILKLIKRDIVLGIGCRKDTDVQKMSIFVKNTLENNNIDIRSVKCIGSIDVKKDEDAILSLSRELDCDLQFFSKEEISKFHDKYEGSSFVEKTVGVRAVSQPVIDILGGEIILDKVKFEGITLTIGRVK